MDKNLYNTEKHLKNMLEGKQNGYLEYLDQKNCEDNLDFETLKRREFVKEAAKNKSNVLLGTNNGVNMIGSGNMFNSKNIETMLAREKYLKENGVGLKESQQGCNKNQSFNQRESEFGQYNKRNSSQIESNMEGRESYRSHPKDHNDKLFRAKRQSYNQSISSKNEMNDTMNRRSTSNNPYTNTNNPYTNTNR